MDAQTGRLSAGAFIGPSLYRFEAAGTGVVMSPLVRFSPVPLVAIEASVPYFNYSRSFQILGITAHSDGKAMMPELTVEGQTPPALVRLSAGVGVGWALRLGGFAPSGAQLHLSGGIGVRVSGQSCVRGHVRRRTAVSGGYYMTDFAIGVEMVRRGRVN